MAAAQLADLTGLLPAEALDYLLSPKDTGYDIWKTSLYSIILAVAVYFVFLVMKRLKVKVDYRLALAASPYIVLGSSLRVVKDAGILESYLFVTPGIYALIFLAFFTVMLASLLVERKFGIPYHFSAFIIGLVAIPVSLSQVAYPNLEGAGIALGFLLPWVAVLRLVKWSPENKAVSLLHLFDANTTFTALAFYGYYEQHVIPTMLIGALGPYSFVLAKIAIVTAALCVIDRISIDGEFAKYVKLVIGILGAATGARDFITLAAGI